MKSFSITIPDSKERLFVAWMKSISFVKKIEAIPDSDATVVITEDQKQEVNRRLKKMENLPESSLTWDEIEHKIKL
ncbi:MAG: hypothetical protein Q7U54_03905 [Bacteroidales bacterium]|nr:hypothetical protein [Bacteroidales bacterium]